VTGVGMCTRELMQSHAARALGLTVPPSILALADAVIE
jgi:hypothetical protein